jgi:L-iditol 2-dehydrogenase
MSPTMKLGMYFRNDDVRVQDYPVPVIGRGEVLVRVEACGVCASDTMEWYRAPQTRATGWINTGHEIAGTIAQVGADVRNYRLADRVVVSHHFPCMNCTVCRDGNETACEFMHRKHIEPGGFSQYIRVMESGVQNGLFLLPDSMTFAQGAFVEPLGCVVRSIRKTLPIVSHTAVVIGTGLAGLLHIKVLRSMGVARIVAVDANPARLEMAVRFGAHEAVLAGGEAKIPQADRVYVCTGSPKASEAALECVTRGTQVMYFATAGPDMQVPLSLTKFWLMQPTVNFTYGAAPRDFREAMELIRSGTVAVDDLVTHSFGIDQIAEAFDLVANPRGNSLKVIVAPNSGNGGATQSVVRENPPAEACPPVGERRMGPAAQWLASSMTKKLLLLAMQKLTSILAVFISLLSLLNFSVITDLLP